MGEKFHESEPVKEEKLSIEDAVALIDGKLDAAEEAFFKKHNRYPDLLNQDDYVSLGTFINFETECKNTMGERDDMGYYKSLGVAANDFASRLLQRFLKRQGVFGGEKQELMMDAFFGRLFFNPPVREFEFRNNALRKLQSEGVSFPDEKTLKDLIVLLMKVGETGEAVRWDKNIDNEGVGVWMTNPAKYPAIYLSDYFKKGLSYERMIADNERVIESSSKYAEAENYK